MIGSDLLTRLTHASKASVCDDTRKSVKAVWAERVIYIYQTSHAADITYVYAPTRTIMYVYYHTYYYYNLKLRNIGWHIAAA